MIPALAKLWQKGLEFKASLGLIERLSQKSLKRKKGKLSKGRKESTSISSSRACPVSVKISHAAPGLSPPLSDTLRSSYTAILSSPPKELWKLSQAGYIL